jgi:Ethanolamine utilization protein EutJ (predicted chaperonin)
MPKTRKTKMDWCCTVRPVMKWEKMKRYLKRVKGVSIEKVREIKRENKNGVEIVIQEVHKRPETTEEAEIFTLGHMLLDRYYINDDQDFHEAGWGDVFEDEIHLNLVQFDEAHFVAFLDDVMKSDDFNDSYKRSIKEIKDRYEVIKPIIQKLLQGGWQKMYR